MSISSLTPIDNPQIRIPKSSFIAFRLIYSDSKTISETSKCVFLGRIPDVWLDEKRSGILSSSTSHMKDRVAKNFRSTVSTIHSSVRNGATTNDEIEFADQNPEGEINIFSRSNKAFSKQLKKELSRLKSSSKDSLIPPETDFDDASIINANIESDANRESDTGLDTGLESDTYSRISDNNFTPQSSYSSNNYNQKMEVVSPVKSFFMPQQISSNVPEFNIQPVESRYENTGNERMKEVESIVLEEGINDEDRSKLNPKVNFDTKAKRNSNFSKVSITKPQPTDSNPEDFLIAAEKHEKYRKKLKKLAQNSKARASAKKDNLQLKVYKSLLKSYKAGQVVRTDKMLVMVKEAYQVTHANKFSELEPFDTRVYERWNEFFVVLRKSNDASKPLIIQLYDAININESKKKPTYEIILSKDVHAQFYSTTDKSISISVPNELGLVIYIFQSHFQITSYKWLYFIKQVLGHNLDNTFNIHLVALDVKMNIKLPRDLKLELMESNDYIEVKKLENGYSVVHSRMIEYIKTVIFEQLKSKKGHPKICEFLKKTSNPWFCYKNYDRLEWIINNSELFYIQQQLLSKTFLLQFLELSQEPRTIESEGTLFHQPYPIEGFLARLTNTLGKEVSFLRTFHKMLYFFTSDHILFFTKYYRGVPPSSDGRISTSDDVSLLNQSIPDIYVKSPFDLDENNHITWLDSLNFEKHDEIALSEFERRTQQVAKAEGLLDLCSVKSVRPIPIEKVQKAHKILQCLLWYSSTSPLNDDEIIDSSFEIELINGSCVKLQAPSRTIRDEWIIRLKELVDFWRIKRSDFLSKAIDTRDINESHLNINEYVDSNVVQEANDLEFSHSYADPHIHNISSIAMLNSVIMSGHLYQKHKKHSNFSQYFVVLCPGFLLLFTLFRRSKVTGDWQKSSYFEHYLTIPIADCYLYSGNSTSLDLLDRQKDFDSMNPGHHSLPRLYADGWKSSEEEPLRCFTLWFGKKRHISGHDKFAEEKYDFDSNKHTMPKNPGLVNMVRKAGFTGRSLVFMARSRQEREMWVSKIYTEIDRFCKE